MLKPKRSGYTWPSKPEISRSRSCTVDSCRSTNRHTHWFKHCEAGQPGCFKAKVSYVSCSSSSNVWHIFSKRCPCFPMFLSPVHPPSTICPQRSLHGHPRHARLVVALVPSTRPKALQWHFPSPAPNHHVLRPEAVVCWSMGRWWWKGQGINKVMVMAMIHNSLDGSLESKWSNMIHLPPHTQYTDIQKCKSEQP